MPGRILPDSLLSKALVAESADVFDQELTCSEETKLATALLQGSELYTKLLPEKLFLEALSSDSFDFAGYYKYRKTSSEERNAVSDALVKAATSNTSGVDKTISLQAIQYFCPQELYAPWRCNLTLENYVSLLLKFLSIEQIDGLNVWKTMPDTTALELYVSPLSGKFPTNGQVRSHLKKFDAFFLEGTLLNIDPTYILPHIKDASSRDQYIKKYVASDLNPNCVWASNLYSFLPHLLDLISKKEITLSRLKVFEMRGRLTDFPDSLLPKLYELLQDEETSRLLQQAYPTLVLEIISRLPLTQHASIYKHIKLELISYDLLNSFGFVWNMKPSVKTSLYTFVYTYFSDSRLAKEVLEERGIPLACLILPTVPIKLSRKTLVDQNQPLTAEMLAYFFKHRRILISEVCKAISDKTKLVQLFVEAQVPLPFKHIRQLGTSALVLQALSVYKTLHKRPKCLRTLAYSYACDKIDLSALYPSDSTEFRIIKRLIIAI